MLYRKAQNVIENRILNKKIIKALEKLGAKKIVLKGVSFKEDELGFLKKQGTPLFIDEAQKVPTIFESIKENIENENLGYGSYILSGSQKLKLHEGEETLAGRVSINELSGLSLRELHNVKFYNHFVPSTQYIESRGKKLKKYGIFLVVYKMI
mgnify:CR=1 FL=1